MQIDPFYSFLPNNRHLVLFVGGLSSSFLFATRTNG